MILLDKQSTRGLPRSFYSGRVSQFLAVLRSNPCERGSCVKFLTTGGQIPTI